MECINCGMFECVNGSDFCSRGCAKQFYMQPVFIYEEEQTDMEVLEEVGTCLLADDEL